MVDPSVIASAELFAGLDDNLIVGVAAASQRRELRRRDILFSEGDRPDCMFIVLQGRIAISNRSPDGKESIVALMKPTDLFGEMGLFDGLGRSADARALERSVVVAVPYASVREVYQARPALLWRVVDMLARRLRSMDSALADSVFLDVDGRTAKRLLELAGDDNEFVLPITQEELAQLVGASRERVNKALNKFIRLGWIAQEGRTYVVTDRDQLRWRAGP